MDVIFDGEGFSRKARAELEAVLQRIAAGEGEGCWREQPDAVLVRGRLTDGRSGCEVLDLVVKTRTREAPMVAKVGPFHELEGEWGAFVRHLGDASSLFAPIRAATPAVLGTSPPAKGEREAVVYDHAARFAGRPERPPETFEGFARRAVREGGPALDRAERALGDLFTGVRNDLYDQHEARERETSAREAWDLRLGIAAVLEVDDFDPRARSFDLADLAGERRRLYPLDLLEASASHDVDLEDGAWVEVRNLRAEWWGERLMGRLAAHPLRLEVATPDGRTLRRLAEDRLAEGDTFHLRGRVRTLRARAHRERLLSDLPELAEAPVADPFAALPGLLEARRAGRLTALVHGDLNPRNVLLVGDQPMVIDYAFTGDGEPFFLDFTRLEGCLARDVLPDDLTLAHHLRLQRLLAAACRLGERGADRFAQRLAAERSELGAAFRLLWSVRRAARDACPQAHRRHWLRDYSEQLFFFAHLSLKWQEQTPAALRAAAAMAGVAAESLAGADLYRHWRSGELRGDGLEVMRLAEPGNALVELAAMARALGRRRKEEDQPLLEAHEALRADFVRARFAGEANRILVELEQDHGVYISLRAYIDLRGRLHAGRSRRRMSYEEMVESDAALAEAERLRGGGERREDDVLRLLAEQPAVVLIGDAGAGKSTVAREWQYQLARAVAGRGDAVPRLPLVVRAPDLRAAIGSRKKDDRASIAEALERRAELLEAGAIHLTVDALNELPEADKQRVAEWIVALRRFFPATPVVACHRQYNYTPGLLPFPVVGLEKVEASQARRYVFAYLRENDVDDAETLGERLATLLLDDPEHAQVRDLAQTPLFLWMLVERYRKTGDAPLSRGRLFEDFSRWYLEERHHEEHDEPVASRFPFEDKADLLGRLGYALVERGATDLEESEVSAEPAMLEEIVASELLLRGDGKLRFLHQSFQEYFAARHFLAHEAGDPAALKRKVWTLGWHDTFAVLLGFAGEAEEVVAGVVEAALVVNPVLTARCLRMSEAPVDELLERFVAAQEEVLRDPDVGQYARERAAWALAEHGRGPAREALLQLAADQTSPDPARAEVLRILSGMPRQARFEPVREKMRGELKELLAGIFDAEAPEEVREAAIRAVAAAGLGELGVYLSELVQAESRWPLRKAAWDALVQLEVPPTARLRAAFVRACEERLEATEAKLYDESVVKRMDALNDERVEILEQIATPEQLPLLLDRRFRYRIHDRVRIIVDRVVQSREEPPEEARTAWEILREEGDERAVERWWRSLREGSGLDVLAAAHRLAALGEVLNPAPIRALLAADLDAERLAAVAEFCSASKDTGLVEPVEKLARTIVESADGAASVEALTQLVAVLSSLAAEPGRRLAVLADMVFFTRRAAEARPGFYPWWRLSSEVALQAKDCDALLILGGEDAKAAIWDLGTYGALFRARPVHRPVTTTEESLSRFREIAEQENELLWQHWIARASAQLHATGLLPLLLSWANRPELESTEIEDYDSTSGQIRERLLAFVLRGIGFLARLLLDGDSPARAADAIDFLHDYAASLAEAEDRSLVVGCTTALGYLGEWEPILTHLGPGEPWMHQAARNIFTNWISKDHSERERAARWIVRRLHQRHDLAPEVRSTLGKLLYRLERQIGRHVGAEEIGDVD